MDLMHVVVLALIQGVTEFLPISSSAHLILPSQILGWPDQGLAFDVAVHLGTLLAVILYFRKDIVALIHGWLQWLMGRGASTESRLAWCIVVATIPAGLAGLLFNDFIEAHLRSAHVIAITTLLFGVALGVADRLPKLTRDITQFTLMTALIVGLAQALALIPGTSRSGITITAALLLGFTRNDSARFSFLLSIPIIVLSGGYTGAKLLLADETKDLLAMSLGVLVSGVSAYFCIHYFLSFINRLGMMPFVIYRLLLGLLLVLFAV